MTPSKHRKTTCKNNRNPSREYASNQTENKVRSLFVSVKHRQLIRKEKNNSGLHSDSNLSQQTESGVGKDIVPSGMKVVSSSKVVRGGMLPRVAYRLRGAPPKLDDKKLIEKTKSAYSKDEPGKR